MHAPQTELQVGTASKQRRKIIRTGIVLVLLLIFIFWNPFNSSDSGTFVAPNSDGQAHHYLVAKQKAEKLDQQYLSRLLYQPAASSHGKHAHGNKPILSNYTSTIVIGRMEKETERVQWVYDKLLDITDRQIYVVDATNTTLPHLDKNHGREAAVYMKYIIDHYDNLNDITFFWHNDEKVWHNNLLLGWDSVETLNRMDRDNIMKSGYVPSRCDHWPGCPAWIRFNPSKAEHRMDPHKLEEMFNPQLLGRLFPTDTEFPPYFAGTCCSQFAVSRNAIHSRPVEVYKAILQWILEYESDDRSGMVFEYLWPYIFTHKGTHCPSMEDCYCKTYNLCIADPKQIESLSAWNSERTRREEVKWQITFMEDARDTRQRIKEAKGESQEEILEVEHTFNVEIDRLTSELEILVNKTWEMREQIIRHWRLPAPPVGW